MDGSDKARCSGGEIRMVENQNRREDLVINISEYEKHTKTASPDVLKDQKSKSPANSPLKEMNASTPRSVTVSSLHMKLLGLVPAPIGLRKSPQPRLSL